LDHAQPIQIEDKFADVPSVLGMKYFLGGQKGCSGYS